MSGTATCFSRGVERGQDERVDLVEQQERQREQDRGVERRGDRRHEWFGDAEGEGAAVDRWRFEVELGELRLAFGDLLLQFGDLRLHLRVLDATGAMELGGEFGEVGGVGAEGLDGGAEARGLLACTSSASLALSFSEPLVLRAWSTGSVMKPRCGRSARTRTEDQADDEQRRDQPTAEFVEVVDQGELVLMPDRGDARHVAELSWVRGGVEASAGAAGCAGASEAGRRGDDGRLRRRV